MPKTLLLADDSVTIQKVVGISFANEDVALLTVDNGDDAIARVREARPDIVLADVVMPGMNGYEVCEAIKSDPELRNTPVLLLTGTFEAFDEERATRAGADGHITKPFEAQSLVDQVNTRLAQAVAAAPEPVPAPPSLPEPMPAPEREDSFELQAAPEASPDTGASFDFFDEEITEPRAASTPASGAETMIVSDDLGFDAGGEEAFAFDAGGDFQEDLSTSFPSSPGSDVEAEAEAEVEADAEPLAPLAQVEMAPDSTVAILPEDDAFESALTEPPTATPMLGEADLAAFDSEEPPATPEPVHDLEELATDLDEEAAPTYVIGEAPEPELDPEPIDDAISGASDATLILSDLDTDSVASPARGEAAEAADPMLPASLSDDPLAQLEPDDLAVGSVLDPAGGRNWDISSSDLGDLLHEPAAPREEPEQEISSPWPEPEPVMAEPNLPVEPEPDESPEAPLDMLVTAEEDAAPVSSLADAPDLSPLRREQLHDALEKIAWEAFSNVTEQIVKEALERIEKVAWEVIPQMTEALILEEIQKLKEEDD